MLKGWTLTDLHCDKCRVTPLMREPPAPAEREGRDRIQFCALCDGGPTPRSAPPPPLSTITTSSTSSSYQPRVRATPDSEDSASKISSLLLKGYSLLGTNCPNATCRGIPLVGFPRNKDGTPNERRKCVECESTFAPSGKRGTLRVIQTARKNGRPSGQAVGGVIDEGADEVEVEGESPRTRRRRELYGIDEVADSKGKSAWRPGHEEDMEVMDDEEEMEMDDEKSVPTFGASTSSVWTHIEKISKETTADGPSSRSRNPRICPKHCAIPQPPSH